jgi:hypothetical protein
MKKLFYSILLLILSVLSSFPQLDGIDIPITLDSSPEISNYDGTYAAFVDNSGYHVVLWENTNNVKYIAIPTSNYWAMSVSYCQLIDKNRIIIGGLENMSQTIILNEYLITDGTANLQSVFSFGNSLNRWGSSCKTTNNDVFIANYIHDGQMGLKLDIILKPAGLASNWKKYHYEFFSYNSPPAYLSSICWDNLIYLFWTQDGGGAIGLARFKVENEELVLIDGNSYFIGTRWPGGISISGEYPMITSTLDRINHRIILTYQNDIYDFTICGIVSEVSITGVYPDNHVEIIKEIPQKSTHNRYPLSVAFNNDKNKIDFLLDYVNIGEANCLYGWKYGYLESNNIVYSGDIPYGKVAAYSKDGWVLFDKLNGEALLTRFSILSNQSNPPVVIPLSITKQPESFYGKVGDYHNLSVSTDGTLPISFQWRRNDIDILNANDNILQLDNLQLSDNGRYNVLVYNVNESISSQYVMISVTNLSSIISPSIISQPVGYTGRVGDNHTLLTSASGDLPLYYQWRRDELNILNANNNFLVLNNLQLSNNGYYDVIITNSAGQIISTKALVNVTNVPVQPPDPILIAPQNLTSIGSRASMTLSWTDTSTGEDRWEVQYHYKNKGPWGNWITLGILPENSNRYSFVPKIGQYEFRIKACKNTNCSLYSNIATIRIR